MLQLSVTWVLRYAAHP